MITYIKELGFKRGLLSWLHDSAIIDYYKQSQGVFIFFCTCFIFNFLHDSLFLQIIAWIIVWWFYEFYFSFGRECLRLLVGTPEFKLKQGDKFL